MRMAATAVALLSALTTVRPGHASVPGSYGDYIDASGSKQSWHVNARHTLIWNDKPFVPVGGLFEVRSWAAGGTEADWIADKTALALLKAHGIVDLCLRPPRGVGLTDVAPAAIQRVIDLLDAQGFTYGISIDDGPREPLNGYMVRPGVYRQVVPDGAASVTFNASGVDSYLYFVVSQSGLDVLASGEGTPRRGTATIAAKPVPGLVTFLIPKVGFPITNAGSTIGYPNLWDGFDNYRDSLLALFRGVHLGSGFRFFSDPLPPNLTVTGSEAQRLIPTGIGFTTEWSAYLGKKYKTLGALEQAWAILDRDTKNIDQAAQFVPLWSGGKGIQDFYDRSIDQKVGVDTQRSAFWQDLTDFKTQSIQRYMSDLAIVLKRAVADVPVVYRASGHSSLLADLPADDGFDGIAITAYGRGDSLVRDSAGYVYAQASDAPRTMWLPVIGTADAPPSEKTGAGYSSKLGLNNDLDYLREIGARGFYVDSVHVADPADRRFDLSAIPEQLDWLADYEKLLVAAGVRTADAPSPNTIFYPRGMPSAMPRPLPNGGWWLPTDRPGFVYDLGPIGRAYGLSEEEGTVFYLFRPDNTAKTVTLRIPKASLDDGPKHVRWFPTSAGELHKNVLTLTIGPDPVRILNLTSLPIPQEAFPALMDQTSELLDLMKERKVLEAPRFREELALIKIRYDKDDPYRSLQAVESMIPQMRAYVQNYAWYEAESDRTHSFDEQSDTVGASSGRLLRVDARPAGAPPAISTYDVTGTGTPVEVWAAASPNAPLSFRLDGQPLLDHATVPQRVGAPYADGKLVWTLFGTATIPRGTHKLQVRAGGPLLFDVLLLTPPGTFVPDGVNPPSVLPKDRPQR